MRKILTILFIVLAHLTSFAQSCDTDSCEVLKLYKAIMPTHSDSGAVLWDTLRPLSTWHGVFVSNDTVIAIDLDGTTSPPGVSEGKSAACDVERDFIISGKLPSEIYLPELEIFSIVGSDSLYGTVPSFKVPASGFLKIKGLGLKCSKGITGTIPDFTEMPLLEELDLSLNCLSGALPRFSQCVDLNLISLRGNKLTSLPNDFASGDLTYLYVENNCLQGDVSTSINIQNNGFVTLAGNKYTFSNLIDFYFSLPTGTRQAFFYEDQEKLPKDTILFAEGFRDTLYTFIDTSMTTLTYSWEKDNIDVQTLFKHYLPLGIISGTTGGEYTVEIKDSILTDLTLKACYLVETCQPGVLRIDSILCPGEFIQFQSTVFDENNQKGLVRMRGMASNGCDSIIDIQLSYYGFTSMDTLVCDTNVVEINVVGENLPTGLWTVNQGSALIANPLEEQTQVSGFSEGENLFVWEQTFFSCPNIPTPYVLVSYVVPPQAASDSFVIFPNTVLMDSVSQNDLLNRAIDTFSLIDATFDLDFLLMDGTFQFSAPYNELGRYTFSYTICSELCPRIYCDTTETAISIIPEDNYLIISPNGDFENDYLVLRDLGPDPAAYNNSRVEVYNRAGQQVFSQNRYFNTWDGRDNNGRELPMATYYLYFWKDWTNGREDYQTFNVSILR